MPVAPGGGGRLAPLEHHAFERWWSSRLIVVAGPAADRAQLAQFAASAGTQPWALMLNLDGYLDLAAGHLLAYRYIYAIRFYCTAYPGTSSTY
eukprot:SAG31_NODE_5829_length_2306_cov_1.319891_4_plen_93_part_00